MGKFLLQSHCSPWDNRRLEGYGLPILSSPKFHSLGTAHWAGPLQKVLNFSESLMDLGVETLMGKAYKIQVSGPVNFSGEIVGTF